MNHNRGAGKLNNDRVIQSLQAGKQALSSNNKGEARYSLLEAARSLYSTAGAADSQQRERQLEMARHLRDRAASLPPDAPRSPKPPVAHIENRNATPLVSQKNLGDVAGCDEVKRIFMARFIYPLYQPHIAERYRMKGSGGVLLYGPPGTGKTMLVRTLANEMDVPVFIIRPAEILSKWLGESEKKLAELFDEARQHPAAIIFVDEVDGLVSDRDGADGRGAKKGLQSQLLAELDGFDEKPGKLFFLGATNRPWDIDKALLRPGRFDAIAYVSLPDSEARLMMLKNRLAGLPLAQGFDARALLPLSENYSGAEVHALVATAAESAFIDACEGNAERLMTLADFEAASRRVHRAASPKMLARYADFARSTGQLPEPLSAASSSLTGIDDRERSVA